MSTFQGERFVRQQLISILNQMESNGRILVRDDGSRDHTVAAIEAIADPRITILKGSNLGFSRSFLTLLNLAPADADMVMFSDQDDVWLPGKIDRAWQHLQALGNVPGLYGSAQMLVDSDLQPLQRTAGWPRGPSFAGALTENIVTGCTAAINCQALELLRQAGVPDGVYLHDWWLYLVVSAFGRVVFDDEPTLLYRQHGANQIGHGAGWLGRQAAIVRFLMRNDWVGILLGQVHALRQHYWELLDPEARHLLCRYFLRRGQKMVPSWRLVFSARRWRKGPAYEIILRLLLAMHRLHVWPPTGRRL